MTNLRFVRGEVNPNLPAYSYTGTAHPAQPPPAPCTAAPNPVSRSIPAAAPPGCSLEPPRFGTRRRLSTPPDRPIRLSVNRSNSVMRSRPPVQLTASAHAPPAPSPQGLPATFPRCPAPKAPPAHSGSPRQSRQNADVGQSTAAVYSAISPSQKALLCTPPASAVCHPAPRLNGCPGSILMWQHLPPINRSSATRNEVVPVRGSPAPTTRNPIRIPHLVLARLFYYNPFAPCI